MRADIHDGQEHQRSTQGPDTEAPDQSSPDHQIPLATHGRSIQIGQQRCFERATATSALTLEADIRLPRTNRRDGPLPDIAAGAVRTAKSAVLMYQARR